MAHLATFIVTDDLRGHGTEEDPARRVLQLWTLEGHLVAEHDALKGSSYWNGGVKGHRWPVETK